MILFVFSLWRFAHEAHLFDPLADSLSKRSFLDTNSTDPSQNIATTPQYGWVGLPNVRGTYDILLSCATTLLLCSWTAYHGNIAKRSRWKITKFFRKFSWISIGFFMPEMILMIAYNQYIAAKGLRDKMNRMNHYDPEMAMGDGAVALQDLKKGGKSMVKHLDLGGELQPVSSDSSESGSGQPSRWDSPWAHEKKPQPRWTLQEAFFINAGGLCVDSSSFHPLQQITFTALGVIELAKAGILPRIDSKLIEDKSKADAFAKMFVCMQAGWFLVQCIARAVMHLPVTPLELHTVAHIVTAAGIYGLWWHKPYDVDCAYTIDDDRVVDLAALLALDQQKCKDRDPYTATKDPKVIHRAVVRAAHAVPLSKYGDFPNLILDPMDMLFSTDHIRRKAQKARIDEQKVAVQTRRANRALDRLCRKGPHIDFEIAASDTFGQVANFFGTQYVTDEAGPLVHDFNRAEGECPNDSGSISSFLDGGSLGKNMNVMMVGLVFISAMFGVPHLVGWWYPFPTVGEMWAWRASGILLVVGPFCPAALMLLTRFMETKVRRLEFKPLKWLSWLVAAVLFTILFTGNIAGVAWIPARLFLAGEALASLRQVPAGTYATVNWSNLIPHI